MTYASGTGTSISYLNTTDEFGIANAQLKIYGGFDGSKASVTINFTGVEGHEYMFKIEQNSANNVEARVTATGASQSFTLDLSGKTAEERALFNSFVFFHTAPTNPVEGTIIVHGWSYPS